MSNKRLYKSTTDKKVFGVCGGLGEYFNIDPTIIRVILVISLFGYGFGFLPYFILGMVLPNDYEVKGVGKPNIKSFANSNGDKRKDVTPEDSDEDWSDF